MDEHPRVRFVDGPAGRRARLDGTGLDVWEVIATVRCNDENVAETAAYLHVPIELVEAAVGYYAGHSDEIDEIIASNERESREAHAAWRRENGRSTA